MKHTVPIHQMVLSGLIAVTVSGVVSTSDMFAGTVVPMNYDTTKMYPMLGEPATGGTTGAMRAIPVFEHEKMPSTSATGTDSRMPMPTMYHKTYEAAPKYQESTTDAAYKSSVMRMQEESKFKVQLRTTKESGGSSTSAPVRMNESMNTTQTSSTSMLEKEIKQLEKKLVKITKSATAKEASALKKVTGRAALLQKKADKTTDAKLKAEYLDAITQMKSYHEDWLDEFRLTTEEQTDDMQMRLTELKDELAEAQEVQ